MYIDDNEYYYDLVYDIDSLTEGEQEIMSSYGLSVDVDESLIEEEIFNLNEINCTVFSASGVDDNDILILFDCNNEGGS